MDFEKWQALGNDYVVIEAGALPFELTPPRVQRLCDPHLGVGSDGILLLSEAEERGFVARLQIFNPDGSEAELSGNGAREAALYLHRRGWTDSETFSIQTAAGEIRARITGPDTCRLDMGRAKVGAGGTLESAGRRFQFERIDVGNPQCAIEIPEGLDELDLSAHGPPVEGNLELFPERTNVSFWRCDHGGGITARIFERGVGETMASGTGATGAAVAAVLRGADSPVTVHLAGGDLEVEVGEDMHIDLTGWAVAVYRGALSDELMGDLNATE